MTNGDRAEQPARRVRTRRLKWRIGILATATLAAVLGSPSMARAAQTYYITADGVAVRSGPGTGYTVLTRLNNGATIQIYCQVQNGTSVGGNATWDNLGGNQWVSDYYTSTPSFNSYAPGLGDCNAAPPPTGGARGPALVGLAGKCVDVRGGNSANSTPVQLYDCNRTAAQVWVPSGATLRALGKCLDVAGGGRTNGTRVQLYDCNGTGAQNWQFTGTAFRNPQSGRCLDVPGANSASGTQLQIYDCNGTAAQAWHMLGVRGATASTNTGTPGQCTWGAKEKFHQAIGVYPLISGNAKDWASSASANGWTVEPIAQPRSIVVFQPGVDNVDHTYGHVAWVDSVELRADGLYVHVTEMNGTAGPYNWDTNVYKDVPGMSYILAA